MYEFMPATERIQHMRELIRDRICRFDSERALIVTEAYKATENVVPIIRRPMAALEIAKNMTVRVEDFELIVGNRGKTFFAVPQYPEWGAISDWVCDAIQSGEWDLREDGLYHNPPDEVIRMCCSPEDAEAMASVKAYWEDRKVGSVADAWKPDCYDEMARIGVSTYAPEGLSIAMCHAGHLVAGYDTIINKGYGAIRAEAQTFLDDHYANLMGDDVNKYLFYKAVTISCDAATTLVKRYADECRRKAQEAADGNRRDELLAMADGLDWISVNPARNFWEACQAAMLYQVFLMADTSYPGQAFGRFDQYTWPYLKRDLESGALSLDQAQEIVDAFFLKANCFYTPGPAALVDMTGIGNTYQHTTIGGVIPATGEDATNPVTYMVLESVGRLGLHDPTISLRFHNGTPDRLWECAIETSRLVGGLPLYQNDEVIIPALQEHLGFTLEDARDYGLIGCQEIVGCGNDFPAPNGVFPPHCGLQWGTVLDMAINDGVNPAIGEGASLHTGHLYDMKSFDEVKQAFVDMARYLLKMFVSIGNYAEAIAPYYGPHPGLSMSMDGCMEKGLDATMGGCKYNSYGGTATGLATVADSLTTIRYACFEEGLCTTRELYDAVMANWEGYEDLRQRLIAQVPHYGNNDPYADEMLEWVVSVYYDICDECYSTRSKRYKAGMYGASDHIAQGKRTWATPEGRRFGDPIADAMSPVQSFDKLGPTSVLMSTCCFDHSKALDGMAVNIRIHPSALSRQDGMEKLRDMTKAYFDNGGLEVQYNVVSTETLRAAQADPEAYRNLVVRIAGYSAYFVELGKDLQEDIIARTENMI